MEYQPLGEVTRTHASTEEAAYYLRLRPQTLRWHASRQSGPLQPVRVGRRLLWPVAEIKKVLGVAK